MHLGCFFQIKLFKSLHLLSLLVLSKPGTQGEAGGHAAHQVPTGRAQHLYPEDGRESSPTPGEPLAQTQQPTGHFPRAALVCGFSGPGTSLCPCVSRCPENAKVPAAPDAWLSSHL